VIDLILDRPRAQNFVLHGLARGGAADAGGLSSWVSGIKWYSKPLDDKYSIGIKSQVSRRADMSRRRLWTRRSLRRFSRRR
jgi:hypothetical protein